MQVRNNIGFRQATNPTCSCIYYAKAPVRACMLPLAVNGRKRRGQAPSICAAEKTRPCIKNAERSERISGVFSIYSHVHPIPLHVRKSPASVPRSPHNCLTNMHAGIKIITLSSNARV